MEPLLDAAGVELSQEGLRNYLDIADKVAAMAQSANGLHIARCVSAEDLLKRAVHGVQANSKVVAMLLNLNSRLLYCAAVRTALTGHIAPLYPALRACLESACYAEAMTHDPSLAEIWMARHTDAASKKRCRNAFGVKLVREAGERLEIVLEGAEGLIINAYERHIDHGAHPNPAGIIFGMQIGETAENWILNLPGASSESIEYGLFECFETGLFTALVIANNQAIPRQLGGDLLAQLDVRNDWQCKLAAGASAHGAWPQSTQPAEAQEGE